MGWYISCLHMLYLDYIQSWQYTLDGMMVANQCNSANKNILHGYSSFYIGYKDHKVMDYTGHLIQGHLNKSKEKFNFKLQFMWLKFLIFTLRNWSTNREWISWIFGWTWTNRNMVYYITISTLSASSNTWIPTFVSHTCLVSRAFCI